MGKPKGNRKISERKRGGAKLIWFEATAVREEGRANTRQLWIHKGAVGEFARLLEATRRIKQTWPGIRVILLTMYPISEVDALGTGADAILQKDGDTAALEAAMLNTQSKQG